MKCKIEIDMDNAAFEENVVGHEVGRILNDLAINYMESARNNDVPRLCVLRDSNGNTVGTADVAE